MTGDDIGVRAIFRSPLGDFQAVALGHTNGARTVTLHGRIPFDNATLAQLQFDMLNNGRITANAGTGIQPIGEGRRSRSGGPASTDASCRTRSRAGPGRAASAAPRRGSATS